MKETNLGQAPVRDAKQLGVPRMLILGRHRTCAGLSRKWSAIMGNRTWMP